LGRDGSIDLGVGADLGGGTRIFMAEIGFRETCRERCRAENLQCDETYDWGGAMGATYLDYQGCVLIVSHDRYFMDRLVDHLFVFEGDGIVRDFPGNYTQYRIDELNKEKQQENKQVASKEKTPEPEVVQPATKRKLTYKEQREFETLEKELPLLEQEKMMLAEKMSGNISYDELQQYSQRLTAITNELEEKEMRWLELSEMMN